MLIVASHLLGSCGSERELLQLPAGFQAEFWAQNRVIHLKEQSLPAGRILRLPDSVDAFRFEKPIAVAGGGVNGECVFAVSDMVDRAIHWWNAKGQYLGSASGGRRDTTKLPWPGAITITDGLTIVGDSRAMQLLAAVPGSVRAIADLDPRYVAPGFRLAAANSGVLVHRRGAGLSPTLTDADVAPYLLGHYDLHGVIVATGAARVQYPTPGFTATLNEGFVAASGDTTFMVNAATGRVRIFAPRGATPFAAVRELDLGVLFAPQPPVQLMTEAGSAGDVLVARHVLAFDLDHHGNWLALQAKGYAPLDSENEGTLEGVCLVAYSPDGVPLALYGLPRSASAIATSGSTVALLQPTLTGHGTEVRLIDHVLTSGEPGAGGRASGTSGAAEVCQ